MKKLTGFLLVVAVFLSVAFSVPARSDRQIHVVIDAGHGGHDNGMSADQHLEKVITQAIAEKMRIMNANENIILHFTRTGDNFVDLNERIKMINNLKPDLVISLHVNGVKNGDASGLEFFVSENVDTAEQSMLAASALSRKFMSNHEFAFRGIKKAPFAILKKSVVPAVSVELGFLSNSDDRKLITNDAEQDRIAATILEFISEL
jgi:N-acetylmuramoyl-L-alanine amidase